MNEISHLEVLLLMVHIYLVSVKETCPSTPPVRLLGVVLS